MSLDDSVTTTALGSPEDPVILATPATLALTGSPRLHGLVISNGVELNSRVPDNPALVGGWLSCQDFAAQGRGTLQYSAKVMQSLRQRLGQAVRVAGSWTDACTLSGTAPPGLICP